MFQILNFRRLKIISNIRGRMVLEIENKGAFYTIAQKLFGKPRYTKIHLDDNGTFIWPLIDGRKTVEDIAALVKDEFGEKAEPLYPRIVKYFHKLQERQQSMKDCSRSYSYLIFQAY